ncbi:hypothetical protein LINPERHAP1_LOCUS27231 [Linum perenne]
MPTLQAPFSSPTLSSRNTAHLNDNCREFDFWTTAEARYFQSLEQNRLDKGSRAVVDLFDSSTFPSHKRTVSSPLYLQAVAEGRKEMMKMVGDMPESCFELSLKDIVSEVKGQRIEEEDDAENESFQFETEERVKKQSWLKKMKDAKNKEIGTIAKPPLYGRVPRSRSLDTGTVFIKVFNLASLSWKTSRKSTRNSFDRNGKQVDVKLAGESKGFTKNSRSNSHGSSSVSSGRSSSSDNSGSSSGSDSSTR